MLQVRRTGGERGLLTEGTGRTEAKGTGIKLINKNAGFRWEFAEGKSFLAMLISVLVKIHVSIRNATLLRGAAGRRLLRDAVLFELAADVDGAEA